MVGLGGQDMAMFVLWQRALALSGVLAATGCASTQLNYNTLDIASTVESVYTRQILMNLSRTIDEPYAMPSQIDLSAGVIQTSNSVTPSTTTPLSRTITRNGLDVVTTAVTAGTTATVGVGDTWQQNWTISPISDANTLRNLRALYRYVVWGADLVDEYHIPRMAKDGSYRINPYMLEQPHCVLCKEPAGKLQPNDNLHRGKWLYWTSYGGSVAPERLPPPGVAVVNLGHYGNHDLLMLAEHYYKGYLSDFTLFMLPNAVPSETANKPGGPGGPGGGGGRGPNFNVIVPQQIIPAQ
jgi:hypothetical protein